MTIFSIALLSIYFSVVLASPADAAVLGALATAAKGVFAAITATKLGAIGLRALLVLGSSLYQKKKMADRAKDAGIEIKQTSKGGTTPQGTTFGRALTGGHVVYRNSHGKKNSYYTVVIEVSDLPGVELSRIEVDREYCTLVDEPDARWQKYGKVIDEKRTSKGKSCAWVKYYDGSQTAADPMLVELYGNDPERPWTAAHIGTGVAYLIFTFYRDTNVFPGEPQVRLEMRQLAFYDPRKDSSIGGAGAHRWGDRSTYEPSENPIVMDYNIRRGIELPCGNVWGGAYEAEDLPLSSWAAAMNACDAIPSGTTRARFTAGLEVRFTDEPAAVSDQLLASCSAQVAEDGGICYVQVAEPPAPVATLVDGDFHVTSPDEYEPFPNSFDMISAMRVTHPSPEKNWEPHELPIIINAAAEQEDGERRSGSLELPAVHVTAQAAQLGDSFLKDARRWVRHKGAVGPHFDWARPLLTFAWTSAENGYDAKVFEITEVVRDLYTMVPALSFRERDPADMAQVAALELPSPPTVPVRIERPRRTVPGANIEALEIQIDGRPRLGVLRAEWDPSELGDVDGLIVEVRLAGRTEVVHREVIVDAAAGEQLVNLSLPAAQYEGRIIEHSAFDDADWSDWTAIQSPDVRLTLADLDAEVADGITQAQQAADQVQANLTAQVAGLQVDYSAAQVAAQNADQARALAEAARDVATENSELVVDLARDALPSDFSDGGLFWTRHRWLSPDDALNLKDNPSPEFSVVDHEGTQCFKFISDGTGDISFGPRGALVTQTNRRYRVSVVVKQTAGTLFVNDLKLFIRRHPEDYSNKQDYLAQSLSIAALDQWQTFAFEVKDTGVYYKNLRPFLYFLQSGRETGRSLIVRSFKVEDVTESYAASESASFAAVKANEAGVEAAAAQQERIAADTAKAGAEAARDTAVTARNTAQGHASTASSQATLSAGHANDALGHANAAANSATTASSKASDAGAEATAAEQDRIAANAAKVGAETASTTAVAARDTAQGYAAEALETKNTVVKALRNAMVSDFTQDGVHWSRSYASAPENMLPLSEDNYPAFSFTNDGGRVLSYTSGSAGNQGMAPIGVINTKTGHKYRISVRVKQTEGALFTSNQVRLHLRRFSGDFSESSDYSAHNITPSALNQWHDFSFEITDTGYWWKAFRPFLYFRQSSASEGKTLRILSFEVEDITTQEALEASIAQESVARVTDVQALTATQTTQGAQIGTLSATVTQQGATLATVEGKVQAMTGLTAETTDVNGTTRIAGLKATSYANPDGTGGSVLQLIGDDVIADQSISAPKMSVNELSAITGTIGHFKSAPSGERVEIKDDRIEVYDASGTLRVRIGDLS